MTVEEFKNKWDVINAKFAIDKDAEFNAIEDGVVNWEAYINTSPKILWLLKEAYDNDNEGEGGWSLAGLFNIDEDCYKFLKTTSSKKTWYPIIYTSYGILNNFMSYDDMDFIEDNIKMISCLKKIAFLNINKFAGKSKSNDSVLGKIFLENQDILKKQIALLNPDIIIGGNTLKFYNKMLGLSNIPYQTLDSGPKYYFKDDKLFIDAYHPGRIGINRYRHVNEDYIEDIISIVRKCFKPLLP